MKLLVVILNYRTAEMTLKATQAAVEAVKGIPNTQIEIIDNDSQDGSYERLQRETGAKTGWEHVSVHQTGHNGGFGFGNNFSMRRALEAENPPEFIYLLNSDAFPAPDAIERLVTFLDDHGDVGIAGSYIHGTDGEPHLTAFRFPSLQSEITSGFRLGILTRVFSDTEVPIRPMPEQTRAVDWLAGASMMLRTEMLREVGLFDETFFLYFEETDLCRRARLHGWGTWYVVESRVAHVGHGSTGLKDLSKRMPSYWFDSRRYYFLKNHGRPFLWAANVAQAAGLATFKFRARLQGKEDNDPAKFLQDFVEYNFVKRRP